MPNWENQRVTTIWVAEHDGKLPSYAWPGGYPLYYIHFEAPPSKDAHILCPACAQEVWQQIRRGEEAGQLYFEINWEDPELYCECGKRIESAYDEEEEEE